MKKIVTLLLCVAMVLGVVACGSKPAAEASTLGGKLVNLFEEEIGKSDDILAVAEKLATADFNDYGCAVQEFEAGYLPGFTEEISGFKRCVGFMPMVGSIPFVGYIFEADDPEGFKKQIEGLADPRWNICTEAQETVSLVSGNYIFFAMCPGEDA